MKISEFFQQDHERLGAVIESFRQSLEKGTPSRAHLDQLSRGLRGHIFWEEDLLFPLVKPVAIAEIVEEFCTDHALIWKNLGELESGLARGATPGQLELTLNEMVDVLEAHNIDEERTIYAQADQVCDNKAATEFLKKVKGVNTPQDWHCTVRWD